MAGQGPSFARRRASCPLGPSGLTTRLCRPGWSPEGAPPVGGAPGASSPRQGIPLPPQRGPESPRLGPTRASPQAPLPSSPLALNEK